MQTITSLGPNTGRFGMQALVAKEVSARPIWPALLVMPPVKPGPTSFGNIRFESIRVPAMANSSRNKEAEQPIISTYHPSQEI